MGLQLYTAPAVEPVSVDEAIEHLRLSSSMAEPAPGALTAALAGAGAGNVDNGVHRWRVTFVTAAGETQGGTVSAAVTVADKTVNGKVALTAIPTGGAAVTSRKLYRTAAAGSTYLLLATIADNTTTIYTDNTADASLGAGAPSTNTTNDPQLLRLITAARRHAETFTRRRFITQTWDWVMDGFPCARTIEMPCAPLQSVTSITYTDTAGDAQTLSALLYQVDTKSDPGRIAPAYGEVWPSTLGDTLAAVTIRFVCGYGLAAAVPQEIKQAMLLMIGHWYEHREDVADFELFAVPNAADMLLTPFRVLRF